MTGYGHGTVSYIVNFPGKGVKSVHSDRQPLKQKRCVAWIIDECCHHSVYRYRTKTQEALVYTGPRVSMAIGTRKAHKLNTSAADVFAIFLADKL